MAVENRHATDFVALEKEIEARPYDFNFFQVLRRLESRFRSMPRIGHAARPMDEPVRLGQEPHMQFAASPVAGYVPGTDARRASLRVFFFGVFGPNGPLPLHLTEYARQRAYNYADRTLSRFVDIFHHRLLALLYRAWADVEPAVSHDRPETDQVATWVAALSGRADVSMRNRDAMPDLAKLFFTGHLAASSRHPEGLVAMIETILGVPAKIEELVPKWVQLPEDARFRLTSGAEARGLGLDTVLGTQALQLQQRFRIVVGPVTPEQFESLLPGRSGMRTMHAIVRNYVGRELEWELVLMPKSLEPMKLGSTARLGWTSRLSGAAATAEVPRITLEPELMDAL